jgi:outer membrane protein OmpA-like peptidoglycan-associated protein
MKKLVLSLLLVFPVLIYAQNSCDFFQFRKINIEKTDLNTSQSDFGPSFVSGELWFSAFTQEEINKLAAGKDKGIFYNIFSVNADNVGNLNGTKSVQFEKISAGYHAGPVSFSEKTGELFVTLSNFENPEIRNKVYRKADVRLKIVIAKKSGTEWQVIEQFPYNDSTYSVGHPAISVTGDTLIFASDKPNSGFGMTDLYMSVRSNGKWGEPVNLGEKINTPFDEMFPFFLEGSLLFYASNKGDNVKDDFDILYSCKEGSTFAAPTLLSDLNTEKDDFGFVIHPKLKVGYFVSQRDGGSGDDDIYKIRFTGDYNLELVVMDRKTNTPLTNPKVRFSDNIAGSISGVLVTRILPENSSITATTEYEGYMNGSKTFNTTNRPYGIIRDTIWIEKVEVKQVFVLENIFYDFDKWNILPESEIELNKLVKILNDNPTWKVELGSHTDARGSDSYNMILSKKRSDSAVKYIIDHGIVKDRIIAKGYGETQLVNHCKNGVECPDDVHRKNRRTEFKILEMDGK